jgi:hypothetical protein
MLPMRLVQDRHDLSAGRIDAVACRRWRQPLPMQPEARADDQQIGHQIE